MTHPDDDRTGEEPLDPATLNVQRKLRRLIVVSGLTMLIGLLAVFGAILYRVARIDDAARPALAGSVAVPEAGDIVGAHASEGRISVLLRHGETDTLIVFNEATGARIATIAIRR